MAHNNKVHVPHPAANLVNTEIGVKSSEPRKEPLSSSAECRTSRCTSETVANVPGALVESERLDMIEEGTARNGCMRKNTVWTIELENELVDFVEATEGTSHRDRQSLWNEYHPIEGKGFVQDKQYIGHLYKKFIKKRVTEPLGNTEIAGQREEGGVNRNPVLETEEGPVEGPAPVVVEEPEEPGGTCETEPTDRALRTESGEMVRRLAGKVRDVAEKNLNFQGRRKIRKNHFFTAVELLAMDSLVVETYTECWPSCTVECEGTCRGHRKLNACVYAASKVLADGPSKTKSSNSDKKDSDTKERKREKKRDLLRKWISWIHLVRSGIRCETALHDKVFRWVGQRYGRTIGKLDRALVKVQGQLKVHMTTWRKCAEEASRRQENLQFSRAGHVGERTKLPKIHPSTTTIEEFWTGIVGEEGPSHVPDDPILREWEQAIASNIIREGGAHTQEKTPVKITAVEWEEQRRKIKGWKAPGRDQVYGFFWKKLDKAFEILKVLTEASLTEFDLEIWLVEGRTVLIHKPGGDPVLAASYRPIAILNVHYKLITGALTNILLMRAREVGAISQQQRCAKKGSFGTMDCLYTDKSIIQYCRINKLDMSVVWFDYMKAFDLVPHKYIVWLLVKVGLNPNLVNFVRAVVKMWRTRFELRVEEGGRPVTLTTKLVEYKRGAFQGDLFSLIIFMLGMSPISYALETQLPEIPIPYVGPAIKNHLLYCDDLKVYTASEREAGVAIEIVKRGSSATGQKLGLAKCAASHMIRGKIVQGESLEIGGVGNIEIGGDPYKYLGVKQLLGLGDSAATRVERECKIMGDLRKILSTNLSGKLMTQALNTKVLGAVRYYICTGLWNRTQIKVLDQKVRVILGRKRYRESKSAAERLYINRSAGGRGVQKLEDLYDQCVVSLVGYFSTSNDPVTQSVFNLLKLLEDQRSKTLLRECGKVLKILQLDLEQMNNWRLRLIGKNGTREELTFENRSVGGALVRAKHQSWCTARLCEDTKMVGKYFAYATNLGPQSWLWLKSNVSVKVESLMFALQEGVLKTNDFRKRILGETITGMCRKCGTKAETVFHILNGCELSKFHGIKIRHDSVCSVVFDACLKRYGFEPRNFRAKFSSATNSKYNSKPVYKNRRAELYWDCLLTTLEKIESRRPDIWLVIKDTQPEQSHIIDGTVPFYTTRRQQLTNLAFATEGKKHTYEPLRLDMSRTQATRDIFVHPVVIGALGEFIDSDLRPSLNAILSVGPDDKVGKGMVNDTIKAMQREAVIHSTSILRRHLRTR